MHDANPEIDHVYRFRSGAEVTDVLVQRYVVILLSETGCYRLMLDMIADLFQTLLVCRGKLVKIKGQPIDPLIGAPICRISWATTTYLGCCSVSELYPLGVCRHQNRPVSYSLLDYFVLEAQPVDVRPDPGLERVVDPRSPEVSNAAPVRQGNGPALAPDAVAGLDDGN